MLIVFNYLFVNLSLSQGRRRANRAKAWGPPKFVFVLHSEKQKINFKFVVAHLVGVLPLLSHS